MFERTNRGVIYITVLCLLQGVQSDWSGAIKLLLDRTPITSADVKEITSEIFGVVNYTALYQTCLMPPLPRRFTDPEGCDMTTYALLKIGFEHPDQFNGNMFLCGLWSTEYGEALVKNFEKKGANILDLKNAFIQTWFPGNRGKLAESPFDKVFFGRSTGRRLFNNWYTFAMDRTDNTQSGMVYEQAALPHCIEAMHSEYTAKFIYPSHPYIELIAFTLCYWRSDENTPCHVKVTANRTFPVIAEKRLGSDGYYYLYRAEVDSHI